MRRGKRATISSKRVPIDCSTSFSVKELGSRRRSIGSRPLGVNGAELANPIRRLPGERDPPPVLVGPVAASVDASIFVDLLDQVLERLQLELLGQANTHVHVD